MELNDQVRKNIKAFQGDLEQMASRSYNVCDPEMAASISLKTKNCIKLIDELLRYSVSAGQADQYQAEAEACRKALGFPVDSDDVAPVDLVAAIEAIKSAKQELDDNVGATRHGIPLSEWKM